MKTRMAVTGRELDFVLAVAFGHSPTSAASMSRVLRKPRVLAGILAIHDNCARTRERYSSRVCPMTEENVDA